MKALFGSTIALVTPALMLSALGGCAYTCVEDGSGKTCSLKSLQKFDGPPPPLQMLERAPGTPVTIDVLYGNVLVERSTSGKVEVQFAPFDYAGYDDKAGADREMAQNLRATATAAGAITVTVQRAGGSTGLGADAIVRLPDNFDGALTVVNHGDGPVNAFEIGIDYVGAASALNVTNESLLGNCSIHGAPSVRSSNVQCGATIRLFDVSDEVNVTAREDMYDESTAAVTLRLAGVSATSRGGKIVTASGAINATLPRAGGYVVDAKSPVKGAVFEGALPHGCKQGGGANAKTISCGKGPTYELVAGARPNYVGQPKDSNVVLNYQ